MLTANNCNPASVSPTSSVMPPTLQPSCSPLVKRMRVAPLIASPVESKPHKSTRADGCGEAAEPKRSVQCFSNQSSDQARGGNTRRALSIIQKEREKGCEYK